MAQVASKKEQILHTTLDLIAENGFHGTAVSMVAKEANVGMGTIYRYFADKESLIIELYREIKSRLVDAMLAGTEEEASFQKRFNLIWWNITTYYITHPKELSFMEQFANSPYFTQVEQERHELQYPIYQFIQAGQMQGVFKAIPIEILMSTVYGSIVTLVKLHIGGDYILDDKAIEMATAVSWDAVKQ